MKQRPGDLHLEQLLGYALNLKLNEKHWKHLKLPAPGDVQGRPVENHASQADGDMQPEI